MNNTVIDNQELAKLRLDSRRMDFIEHHGLTVHWKTRSRMPAVSGCTRDSIDRVIAKRWKTPA